MAKKGLGKGLGAIFGEDVIKESEEEIAKAKAAVTDNRDGKSGELMVKMALIEPNREQPRKDFNEEQLAELADFAECGLCGTAAVISQVGKIVDHGKEICFPSGMTEMGPITKKLYETLTGIQMGTVEAPEGWIRKIV